VAGDDALVQVHDVVEGVELVAARAVEVVDDGQRGAVIAVARRQVDAVADVAVEGRGGEGAVPHADLLHG